MAVADAAAPRFEMGRVARRTFTVIAANLFTFSVLSAVAITPFVAVVWTSSRFNGGLFLNGEFNLGGMLVRALSWFAYLVSTFLLQAMITHGTVAYLNGRPAPVANCVATGLASLPQLALITVLLFLALMVGAMLLVVPAIIFHMMWFVVVPACVVERSGVLGGFRRSRELTRGNRWPIFGLYLAYFLFAIGFGLALQALTDASRFDDSPPVSFAVIQVVTSMISTMITLTISSTLIASVYYELRQIKEGVGPETLAAVFD